MSLSVHNAFELRIENTSVTEPPRNSDTNTNSRLKKLRETRNGKAVKTDMISGLYMAKLQEAAVFHTTSAESTIPDCSISKKLPTAAKYGSCKIVIRSDFIKPNRNRKECNKFKMTNQYIARL